jgi:hypothetical protein
MTKMVFAVYESVYTVGREKPLHVTDSDQKAQEIAKAVGPRSVIAYQADTGKIGGFWWAD